MTGLLASVTDPVEAELALSAGADLIDCKDPSRGALGALPVAMINAIREQVGVRCPLSATAGDLPTEAASLIPAVRSIAATGVDLVKLGLLQTAGISKTLLAIAPLAARHRLIAVLFADRSPPLSDIPNLAAAGFHGVMLDTANKSFGRLCDSMSADQLADFVGLARAHQLLCGLAGSLEVRDIPELALLRPDYLGFRGALCERERTSRLSVSACARVRGALPRQVTPDKHSAAEWMSGHADQRPATPNAKADLEKESLLR
ncbi:MAG: (5-formylfuran-3-yl)methyl phosphate synthase [Thiohalocapsa sp.]